MAGASWCRLQEQRDAAPGAIIPRGDAAALVALHLVRLCHTLAGGDPASNRLEACQHPGDERGTNVMTRRRTCALVLSFTVLVATVATASGEQPEPACETWNTAEFFGAATVEAVAACLDGGADPMAREYYSGHTPLHTAAIAGTSPEVIELLPAAGAQANARSDSGATTLRAALYGTRRDADVVRALLTAGADPNDGILLNHAAYEAEDAGLIDVLIQFGADLEARDRGTPHWVGGNTALHVRFTAVVIDYRVRCEWQASKRRVNVEGGGR